MSGVLHAARRETQAALGDPGVVLVLVVGVIIYSLFYPIPYLPQVMKEVPVVPVDLDQSSLSRKLLRMADANELVRLVEPAVNTAEAEREVLEGRAGGILIIPEGFERDVLRGEQVTVSALADASYFLIYRQAMTGIVHAVGTLSAGIEIRRLRAQGVSDVQARARRDPLPLELRPLYNPSGGYATFVVPAVFILILQQTLLIGIGMVRGTEREHFAGKTEANLDVVTVVLGRTLFYLFLYTVHAIFYFGVLFHFYGFPQRANPAALAFFLLPFLLAVIFLGLAISALFGRRETSMQALLFSSLPAVFLVGFSWPLEAVPDWLVWAARLLPSTCGIEGFLRLSQMGADLTAVRVELLSLWGLVVLYFLLACLANCGGMVRKRMPIKMKPAAMS